MDLPSCPACGQSVLDDDVDDCPFCGASLKTGKPGAKPAAAKTAPSKAAAPSKPKSAEAAKPAAAPSRSKPAPNPFDDDEEIDIPPDVADDPFAVDSAATKGAIPLRSGPTKGFGVKLICPMCETPGYTSSKSAGKQVKCANPKCMVPVFTAPAPKVEKAPEPPPPPPKSKFTPAVLFGGLLAVVAIGGGVAWSLGLFGGSTVKPTTNGYDPNLFGPVDPPTPKTPETDVTPKPETVTPPSDVAKGSVQDQRKQALDLMVTLARADQPERGKAISRRLAAEAYALSGNMTEARAQIDQLGKVGPNLPFYKIVPLTTIGWEELRLNQADAAKAAAEEAWETRSKLPPFGREPLLISLDLAALMAAVGRMDDAETLIRAQDQQVGLGLLTTPLSQAWSDQSFDLSAAVAGDPALPWTAPHWVAVTKILAARKQWDAALAWSKRNPDPEARTECLVAWAEAAATHVANGGDAKVLEPLAEVAGSMTPAGRARVWACVAARQALAGKNEVAAASVKAAKDSLNAEKVPEPLPLPSMKAAGEYEPPNPVTLRMAAQAAAEIARAEALLQQTDPAAKSLDLALAYTGGIGPTLAPIRDRLTAADKQTAFVRDQLKSELNISSDNEARSAFNSYRRQSEKLLAAAEHRRDLQGRLLASVLSTPLRDNVVQILEKSAGSGDGLRETALPWDAIDSLESAGQKEKADAVRALVASADYKPGPEQATRQKAAEFLAAGKPDQAAAAVEKSDTSAAWKDRLALATASRLVKEGKLDASLSFIRGFRGNAILREEAFALTGSLASRTGQSKKIWEASEGKGLSPAERVALLHGFIVGTLAGGDKPAATAMR